MFLWWLQGSLLFCSSVSKSLLRSFIINLKVRSWILLIILFDVLQHNIHIRGQKLNYDIIMELRINLFWESTRWFNSLDKAPIFWAAFLHKILTWLNVSLLSMVIPRTFSSLLLLKINLLKIKASFSVSLTRHIEWYLSALRPT